MQLIKKLFLLILFIESFLLFSCSQTEVLNDNGIESTDYPYMLRSTKESLLLKWSCSPNCINELDGFEVQYKIYKSNENWVSLGKTTSSDTQLQILRSTLPSKDSIFEFSVGSLFKNNENTNYTRSSDSQKSSKGGWILHWKLL